ncbi:helix-turn-helix transcriptional regulator [Glycomyces albus]
MSVDYIVRLEQGRSLTPSAQVVASLARALQLNRTETELLYRTADQLPPGRARSPTTSRRGAADARPHGRPPTGVFAADWTLLRANPLWCELFQTPSATEVPGQNLVLSTFLSEGPTRISTPHGGVEEFERALVADLRHSVADLGEDDRFRSLIATARRRSPRFAELWAEGRVAAHSSLVKTVHHPVVGDITLDCDVVTVPDSNIRLIVHTAATGSADAEKLDLLRTSAERADLPSAELAR